MNKEVVPSGDRQMSAAYVLPSRLTSIIVMSSRKRVECDLDVRKSIYEFSHPIQLERESGRSGDVDETFNEGRRGKYMGKKI